MFVQNYVTTKFGLQTYIHTYIRTYIHTYIHTYTDTQNLKFDSLCVLYILYSAEQTELLTFSTYIPSIPKETWNQKKLTYFSIRTLWITP